MDFYCFDRKTKYVYINIMTEIGDYKNIISDRNLFNQTVYTPLSEAIKLLNERHKDPELVARVSKLLNNNIPNIFKENKCGIMARQLATPNHENRTFISLAKENGLHPVFLEYFDDKFTSNNKYKHSLGQLHIQKKIDKNGNKVVENITIIDFNKSNGKKLKEVKSKVEIEQDRARELLGGRSFAGSV